MKNILRYGERIVVIPRSGGGRHGPRGKFHIGHPDASPFWSTGWVTICGADLRSGDRAYDASDYADEVECKACIKKRMKEIGVEEK